MGLKRATGISNASNSSIFLFLGLLAPLQRHLSPARIHNQTLGRLTQVLDQFSLESLKGYIGFLSPDEWSSFASKGVERVGDG